MRGLHFLLVCGLSLIVVSCARNHTAPIPGTNTGNRTVSGEITYQSRIAVPESAIAIVELREGSDDDSRLLAEERIPLAGRQVPVPFSLVYNRDLLSANRATQLRAGIVVDGGVRWISEIQTLQGGPNDAELGSIALSPVRPVAFVSPYLCGDESVEITVVEGQPLLRMGGRDFAMKPSLAASGARFQAEQDPTTVFWLRGEKASFTLRGLTYPACEKVGSVANEEIPGGIVGETWEVTDIQPGGIIDRSRVTMQFGVNGRAAGLGSCNSYSVSYNMDGDSLSFGLVASTMKACIPSLMDQEQRFTDILAAIESYEVEESGTLILNGKDGQKLVMRKAAP
jgi:heat shock protein HslJ/uncharacterized lipoprotein YbaY